MGILITVVIIILCWPLIRRLFNYLLQKFLIHQIKKRTGMDFQTGGRKRREQTERKGSRSRRRRYASDEPIIPKEYAEDVEFTEVKEFSETTIAGETTGHRQTYHESQVSDVEYVEIKDK